ncbi:TRAP transporter permease [Pusillimonas sp.]|uniref:TRAP transporter permease n=1 Tax=Pusillimonas sp. TaxID=3040095 RepID=UPI0037CA348B
MESSDAMAKGWSLSSSAIALLIILSAVIYSLGILPEFGIIIYKEQYLAFFLTLCLALTFIKVSAQRNSDKLRTVVPWYDVAFVVASLAVGIYMFFGYQSLIVGQTGLLTNDKILASVVGIVLLLEAVRRHAGWSMVGVCLVALAYAYFGHHLSGIFETRVIRWDRLFVYTFLGEDSVLGMPLAVAGTIIVAFVLFGQMLFLVGGGDAISNFSLALMGKRRGGPAKVSVVASALFGSLSGSASANVATTGIVTIPMMKKVGYSAEKAAAVEAVSSTGGLILPPIMGATAFIIAEFLGVPYSEVALAALIPALLFFLCVYMQVHFEAGKADLKPLDMDKAPRLKSSFLAMLPMLIPFGVLVYVLFSMSWTAQAAAFIATTVTVICSLFWREKRVSLRKYVSVLISAGEMVVFISLMCAAAGLVVGVLGLTGLGANLAQNFITMSGGNVAILLLLAAIASIVLGMGVPVTAAYIILIVPIGPALVQAGVNELGTHLFIFYFGTLSFLTPPVCLSVFVAASLAKSAVWSTAMYSMRLGVVAYVIPFIFVMNPAFLLQGDSASIWNAVVAAVAGIFLLSAGLVGFYRKKLDIVTRAGMVVLGGVMLWLGASSWWLAALGWFALIGLYAYQRPGMCMGGVSAVKS